MSSKWKRESWSILSITGGISASKIQIGNKEKA